MPFGSAPFDSAQDTQDMPFGSAPFGSAQDTQDAPHRPQRGDARYDGWGSDRVCAPAVQNLSAEGIHQGVHLVGYVMYDAVLSHLGVARNRPRVMESMGVCAGKYLLLTLHRPRNADDLGRLEAILNALGQAGESVVFPVHPLTRRMIANMSHRVPPNILLQEPVGYLDMLVLEENARMILTDSGGVQKEAYWLGVPCITLREDTEWAETVSAGWNLLVGADGRKITDPVASFSPAAERPPLFGDGRAAERVVSLMMEGA